MAKHLAPLVSFNSSHWKIALLLVGHIVAVLLLAGTLYINANPSAPPPLPFFGLNTFVLAEAGLIGIWGGLGTTRPAWRLPAVLAATAYLCVVTVTAARFWNRGAEVVEVLLLISLPTLVTAVVLSGLRYGRRRLRFARSVAPPSIAGGFQFTIPHMLLAMAIVAGVLANGRDFWIFTNGQSGKWMVAFLIPCLIIAEFAMLWAALGVGRPTARLAVAMPTAFVVGAIPLYYVEGLFHASWGRFLVMSAIFGFQAMIIAVSLLVVRSCGWRLVWSPAGDCLQVDATRCSALDVVTEERRGEPRDMDHGRFGKRVWSAAVFAVIVGDLCALAWMREQAVAVSTPGPTSMFESFDDACHDVEILQKRKQALAVVFETDSAEAVAMLLAANGYGIGTVDTTGHSMGGPVKATKLENAAGHLVAIPVRMTMKLPRGISDPRMAPWSEALFLFDDQGNLRHRLGGALAADGVNGDSCLLLSLGTEDQLFLWAMRFEAFRGFKLVSEVHMLRPNVRRVLRVYHFAGDPMFPDPRLHEATGEQVGFGFRGKQLLGHADGIGADGQEHSNWLYWDAEKQLFTGASKLRHGQLPAFEVDLSQSEGFVPTDIAK